MLLASYINRSPKDKKLSLSNDSKTVTTTLRDSLGTVSFSIPARFDTSFAWTNQSDCGKPCNHEQYRFQPKCLPVFKESGFYYNVPDISLDQFTIVHSGYFPFRTNPDTLQNLVQHKHFIERLSSDPYNGKIVNDTTERIYDRYFSIVCMAGFDTTKQKHFAKVAALTTIKGNEIEFDYELKSQDTINKNSFINTSMRFIRTIRLSNGI
ncbi:MAG: hypothetical protein ACJ751_07745 [Niastella sp.]|uniref:hypothetical protein n=1 Tax=Niastella sp. TaxID=1869183 RepID=UPI00389B1729